MSFSRVLHATALTFATFSFFRSWRPVSADDGTSFTHDSDPIVTNSTEASFTVPKLLPRYQWPTGSRSLALVSDVSLGLFLSMSLMSLQLWMLVDLAGPLLILLAVQVVMIATYTIFVVYRVLGANYEAAVICSGYSGLALGATPTAIANMTAVTKALGPAPGAFVVVPLVGAFFIDLANALIINLLLAVFG